MRLKKSFIMILFILTAQFVAAQDEFVIYEGTQFSYSVAYNDGNNYAWEVINSSLGDFEFIADPNFSETVVQWNLAGQYFIRVKESHSNGCSTNRELAVEVQPNNRSSEFEIMASAECFNPESNSFTLPVNLLDNNGMSLSAAYYPMMVEFTINGSNQSQMVDYDNQILQISEDWFTANPTQNTDIIVEITNVTDKYNAPVKPGIDSGTHTRTLFAIPEIEFTEELRRRYNFNEEITAYNISSTDHTLRMEPK